MLVLKAPRRETDMTQGTRKARPLASDEVEGSGLVCAGVAVLGCCGGGAERALKQLRCGCADMHDSAIEQSRDWHQGSGQKDKTEMERGDKKLSLPRASYNGLGTQWECGDGRGDTAAVFCRDEAQSGR